MDSKGQGQAKFKLSKDESELGFKLNVANIVDVAAAHIHQGAAGANGPVVAGLYTGGLIPGRTQGTLAEGVITDADVIGLVDLVDLVNAMRAGETYVQAHTAANPGGEIRGQID